MSRIKASLFCLPLVAFMLFDIYYDSNSLAENDSRLVFDRIATIEADIIQVEREIASQSKKVRDEVRRGIDVQFMNYIRESSRRSRENAAKKQEKNSVVRNKE